MNERSGLYAEWNLPQRTHRDSFRQTLCRGITFAPLFSFVYRVFTPPSHTREFHALRHTRITRLPCAHRGTNSGDEKPKADTPKPVVVSEKALVPFTREALLIDGHNDLPWELRENDAPDSKTSTSPNPRRNSTRIFRD